MCPIACWIGCKNIMTGAGDRKLPDKFHADRAAALLNGVRERWREYASAKFAALLWMATFGWNPAGECRITETDVNRRQHDCSFGFRNRQAL